MHTRTNPLHALAFGRTAVEPFFVGHRLAALRAQDGLTPGAQAEALGLSLDALASLALCRMPRPAEAAAVERIAERVGIGAGRLADVLNIDPPQDCRPGERGPEKGKQ